MARNAADRRVLNVKRAKYRVYDLDGPIQSDMGWLPISYDRRSQQGAYLMRMEPGAKTIEHEHSGMEEFLILDGELTDSDGTVFRAGDFVSYRPGTRHNSWTMTGCVLAVFEWQPPARKTVKTPSSATAARRRSTATRRKR